MRALRAIFRTHKQRLARPVALAGVLLLAVLLYRNAPQPVSVELDLGPAHSEFIELRIAFVQSGEELHGVAFSFPDGAPSSLQHSVRLPAGDFEVHAEARPARGPWLASVEHFRTPSSGPLRIHLPAEHR